MYKNGLVRKLLLISEFMLTLTGQPMIAIHLLPKTARGKSSQTIKFCQLQNITQEIFFLKNRTQNVVKKLVPDPFIKN